MDAEPSCGSGCPASMSDLSVQSPSSVTLGGVSPPVLPGNVSRVQGAVPSGLPEAADQESMEGLPKGTGQGPA